MSAGCWTRPTHADGATGRADGILAERTFGLMAATSEPAAPRAAVQYLSLYGSRTLAWSEYGDPHGTPVFYCHGFPGSRCEAALGDAAARELAVRLRVLGVSGGGPYALACAALMPQRLSRVSVVSGLGELTRPSTLRGMSLICGAALGLFQRAPSLSRWLYGGLVGPALARFPGAAVRFVASIGSPADARVLRDPPVRDVIEHSIGEAFRQGRPVRCRSSRSSLLPGASTPRRFACRCNCGTVRGIVLYRPPWAGITSGSSPAAVPDSYRMRATSRSSCIICARSPALSWPATERGPGVGQGAGLLHREGHRFRLGGDPLGDLAATLSACGPRT
jgi:pimeloyl-ACP methyl ester carboxylesterase